MKKIFVLIFLLTMLSCHTQNKLTEEYKNDAFTIKYTPKLKLDNNREGVDFILYTDKSSEKDDFMENINLVIHDYDGDLKGYIRSTKNEISKVARIISSKEIENQNQKTHRLVFTLTEKGIQLTFLQHSLVKNNKLYLLTFSSKSDEYDKYLPEMEDVMLSFKINNKH